MYYLDYLIHYNKNHNPKNGQFTSGDGDGDGIVDDHHNYRIRSNSRKGGNDYIVSSLNRKKSKIVDNASYLSKKYDKGHFKNEMENIMKDIMKDYYNNRDINIVSNKVSDKLGNIPYDLLISEEKWKNYGEDYVTLTLRTYGKNYVLDTDGFFGKGVQNGVGSDSGIYTKETKETYKGKY